MIYDNWKTQSPYNDNNEIIVGNCEDCGQCDNITECGNLHVCYDCYGYLAQLHNQLIIARKELMRKCKIYAVNYAFVYSLNTNDAKDELDSLLESYPEINNLLDFECLTCKSSAIYDSGHLICTTCGDLL